MAHANYDCCAICDCKMDYAGYEAQTKEDICEECLQEIKKLNIPIKNVEDLKTYIEEEDYSKLKNNLIKLGYYFCCYGNKIDKSVLLRFQPSFMSFEEYTKRTDTKYDVVLKGDDE